VAALCRDKIVSTRLLAAADVPVPDSWVAGRVELLADALADGPLVIKPHRGSQGHGVVFVRDAASLAALAHIGGPVFAQRYVPHDGPDHKLYCIGGQVFGVRRVWPARTLVEKVGEPFPVSVPLRDLVLRVGAVFGMDLFGLDVVVSRGVPFAVDLSSFPGLKGVPAAALRLAEYVYAAARRASRGEPVTPEPMAPLPPVPR
jgi:ribosomal protein S6--L-glutamate ligase